jgi:hypothetical protein
MRAAIYVQYSTVGKYQEDRRRNHEREVEDESRGEAVPVRWRG